MDDSVLTLLDSSFDLPEALPPVEIAQAEPGPVRSTVVMCAGDLVEPGPTVGPQATGGEVLAILKRSPLTSIVAVVDDDGTVLGALERDRILSAFAQPLWYDVYNRRPVWPLSNRRPLLVDRAVPLDQIKQLIAREYPGAIQSGFLIAENGRFAGFGAMAHLLELTVHQAQHRLIELDNARNAAEAAAAARSRFLATMSHELRTPLNAIIGFSDLLMMQVSRGEPAEKLGEYLGDIGSSGRHLLDIINDILEFSKLETGAVTLDVHEFSLEPMIASAVRIARGQSQTKEVELKATAIDPVIVATGDERRLRQVLLNLISNAVKFTPKGGKVEVSTYRKPCGARIIAVTDNGVGISPSDIERVFEPFVQADANFDRASSGTGLGLPLSRKLMELHGGTLHLESKPGQGTTAIVTLPARNQSDRPVGYCRKLLADLQQQAEMAGAREAPEIDPESDQQIDDVQAERGREQVPAEDMLEHLRPHAFEHVRRWQQMRHDLQPARQDRDRVIDRADRRQQEDDEPGEVLRGQAEAQDHRGHDHPEAAAHQQKAEEEGAQGQAHPEDREVIERDRQHHGRQHADQRTDQRHDEERDDMLGRRQRAAIEIGEIPGPELFQERKREAELAAEQYVPQHHARQQHAERTREKRAVLIQEGREEAPDDHLHGRPIGHLDQARPGAPEHIEMPEAHRADPAEGEMHQARSSARLDPWAETSPAARRSRAMSRNTSSRFCRL
jgi:two-component system cell cycle sensor histidine kinase PleC